MSAHQTTTKTTHELFLARMITEEIASMSEDLGALSDALDRMSPDEWARAVARCKEGVASDPALRQAREMFAGAGLVPEDPQDGPGEVGDPDPDPEHLDPVLGPCPPPAGGPWDLDRLIEEGLPQTIDPYVPRTAEEIRQIMDEMDRQERGDA